MDLTKKLVFSGETAVTTLHAVIIWPYPGKKNRRSILVFQLKVPLEERPFSHELNILDTYYDSPLKFCDFPTTSVAHFLERISLGSKEMEKAVGEPWQPRPVKLVD